ncbi:MAG: InlB B-repeat-containing protein, partial [Coriobacteriales bacterium]|nr:InlB B-repeat-containing protein [Coriobacteriales bacterium]
MKTKTVPVRRVRFRLLLSILLIGMLLPILPIQLFADEQELLDTVDIQAEQSSTSDDNQDSKPGDAIDETEDLSIDSVTEVVDDCISSDDTDQSDEPIFDLDLPAFSETVEAGTVSIHQTDITPLSDITISDAAGLLAVLNGSSFSNNNYTVANDITINASALNGGFPSIDLTNCTFRGANTDPGNLITITVLDDTGTPNRCLFRFLTDCTVSDLNIVYNGDVAGLTIAAEAMNSSIYNLNVHVLGDVHFANWRSFVGFGLGYVAAGCMGRISAGLFENISVVIDGQVGGVIQQAAANEVLYAAGFANFAMGNTSAGQIIKNVDATVIGGVYSEGNNAASASGFINECYIYTRSSITACTVIIGSQSSPASIATKSNQQTEFEETFLASGFISYLYATGDDTVVISDNSTTVYGDIFQDNSDVIHSHYFSAAGGLIAGIRSMSGPLSITFTGNSVDVKGNIKSIGPARSYATGLFMSYSNTSNAPYGVVSDNQVYLGGSISATSTQRSSTSGVYNEGAYAFGLAYASLTEVEYYRNKVVVDGSIQAVAKGEEINYTNWIPNAYASGFLYGIVAGEWNAVQIGGDIEATSLYFSAYANGYAFRTLNAASDSYTLVDIAGSVIASGELQACAAGYSYYNQANRIDHAKVEVFGQVISEANGLSMAAGFSSYVASTLTGLTSIQNNSVYVGQDITAFSKDDFAFAGGFIAETNGRDGIINIEANFARIDGHIHAQTTAVAASEMAAYAGGFAAALNSTEVIRAACYVDQGVSAVAEKMGAGAFAADVDSSSTLSECTLLAKLDMSQADAHYSSFIDSLDGTASEMYVVTVYGEKRTAHLLSYDSTLSRWVIAPVNQAALGVAVIKNTDQLAPGFDYLTGYSGLTAGILSWVDSSDYSSARFTAGALTTYPVQVVTAMQTVPHGALISSTGVIFDIIGIQDIRPLASYTVTFDSQGGSPVDPILDIPEGSTVSKPVDPEKTGFDFNGWFTEPESINEWDFANDTVNDSITLFAKWTPTSDGGNDDGNNGDGDSSEGDGNEDDGNEDDGTSEGDGNGGSSTNAG